MTTKRTHDVSIGKFDILATYTYAKALPEGLDKAEAKERGIIASIMGAKISGEHFVERSGRVKKASPEG